MNEVETLARVRRSSRRSSRPVRYVSDSESDNDLEQQDNDEYQSDTRPMKKPKTAKSGRISRNSRQLAAEPLPVLQNKLYDGLADSTAEHETIAIDWIEEYETSGSVSCLTNLANCMIKLSGSDIPIPEDVFNHEALQEEDDDEDSEFIKALNSLENDVKVHPIVSYSLAHKTDAKVFRKTLAVFFDSLIRCASEKDLLYQNDGDFLNPIINWAVALSGSHYRSFRHVGTFTSLAILDTLINLRIERQKIWEKKEKQASKGSKSVRKLAAQQAQKESVKVEITSHYISAILETVFSSREKDIDAKIRDECFRRLGRWMEIVPEEFLGNNYLKYFGWALSDPSAQVRQHVTSSILGIYRTDGFASSLRQFTEKFLDRFIEMATFDSDNAIRKTVVDLLTQVKNLGFIEDDSQNSMISTLIFDSNASVRKAAALFFETVLEPAVDQITANKSFEKLQADHPEISSEWAFFKQLGTQIVALSELPDTTNGLRRNDIFNDLRFKPQPSMISLASMSIYDAWNFDQQKINNLTSMLLFDFSSLSQKRGPAANLVQALSIGEDSVTGFVDILHGWFVASLEQAEKRKTEENAVEQVVETALSTFEPLFAKYHFSTKVSAKILGLLRIVNHDFYAELHKEEEEKRIFDSVVKEFAEQTSEELLLECGAIFTDAMKCKRFRAHAEVKLLDLVDNLKYSLNEIAKHNTMDPRLLEVTLLKVILLPVDPSESVYNVLDLALTKNILDTVVGSSSSSSLIIKTIEFIKGFFSSRIKGDPYEEETQILVYMLHGLSSIFDANKDDELQYECAIAMTDCLTLIKMAEQSNHSYSARFDDDASLKAISSTCQQRVISYYKQKIQSFSQLCGIDVVFDDENGGVQVTSTDSEVSDINKLRLEFYLCTIAAKISTAIAIRAMDTSHVELMLNSAKAVSSRISTVVKLALGDF